MEIIVFASGRGTLFEALCNERILLGYSCKALVVSNTSCRAVEVAKRHGVPIVVADVFFDDPAPADLYVLAGFLRKIPESFTSKFGSKTINSHPSLLPKFGGKGMYGRKVHAAVVEAGEVESGFSIHYVNAEYDQGKIIHQEKVFIEDGETPESLEAKVKAAEREAYPKMVLKVLKQQNQN